ncbi:hypothetical protein BsWGS_02651 [Bradybaena similaris]
MSHRSEYRGGLSVTMKIASSDVGKVIGRGGKKIREFEQAGGGKIKISNAPDENDMKSIDISGTNHDVETTKRMIEDFLRDFNIGDNVGKRGGFSNGRNQSKPGYSSRSEGPSREQRHQDNEEDWCEDGGDDDRDLSGGGNDARSGGFGSGYSEDVYQSKIICNSEHRDQNKEDPWGWQEEDEKADVSSGGRRGGFRGRSVYNSRSEGSSNWRNRDQNQQPNGDRWGRHEQYEKGNRGFGGNRQAVDGDNETIYVMSSEVGKIIGSGGSRIRELEADSGCRIKVSRASGSSDQSPIELSGSKSAIAEAKRLIQETGVEIGNESDHGNRSFGGNRQAVDGDSETIYVMSSEVGKIIGRGGSRIRELEADSECKIKVSRASGSSDQSPIELSGSKSAIAEAKRLIQEAGVEIVSESDHDAPVPSQEEEEEYVSELKKGPLIDWNALREKQKQYEKDRLIGLPEIMKNFYKEEPHIKNMSHEEVKQIRKENNNIIVDAPDGDSEFVPNPIRTFEDAFKHYPLILEQIQKQNFVKPSPIQCQSWPILLQGKDLIGIAQTGTGKTLAFLLPALIHIDNQTVPRESRAGPSALILSPTRELAQQIEMEVNKINYKGIRSICVYGGGNRREQLKKVKKGVEIVVATPGRLNDFMMHGIINVKHVTYLVMDEADRMLDLGFELEIKKVMLDIRPDRQTVMTSATWPPGVQKLAEQYMTKPYKVFVGTLDLAAVHSVTQHVEFVDETEKKSFLLDFISNMTEDDKLIVFVGKKMVADDVSSDLAMNNIQCQCIHGDREQCDRETALEEFKSGTVRILVATDVASRGLDVKDITHVLNYDFPSHIEEYVHRIGRTGRAGRSGTSLTFMTRNDWKNAQQLVDIMSEANQNIPDELVAMAERFSAFKERKGDERTGSGFGGRGKGGRGRRRNDDDVGNYWT